MSQLCDVLRFAKIHNTLALLTLTFAWEALQASLEHKVFIGGDKFWKSLLLILLES